MIKKRTPLQQQENEFECVVLWHNVDKCLNFTNVSAMTQYRERKKKIKHLNEVLSHSQTECIRLHSAELLVGARFNRIMLLTSP